MEQNISSQPRSRENNNLNIDNVVSSHPELGPTPPDGGYGWIILLCGIATQIVIPSIVYAYGVILLFLNLSDGYEENQVFRIYDSYIILVPIMMTVFSLLYKEWGRTLVLISNRPRIVSICGVFLMCGGLLLSNFGANEDNDIIITIASGLVVGIGASLTSQQTEILIRHYFRNKLSFVLSIYKSSVIFGQIIVPLLIAGLLTSHGASTTLVVYSGIVLQLCIAMLFFTRPIYIVKALNQNYKALEEEDDDDETIYSHAQRNTNNVSETQNVAEKNDNEIASRANVTNDDLDDEYVIASFGKGKEADGESSAGPTPNLVRFESDNRIETNENPFGSNFHVSFDHIERRQDPQTLYRATTVASDTNNDFTFSVDPPTSGTLRRTANTKKNLTVMLSILRDWKFYAYTHILTCSNLSTLVLGALLPAFVSQQLPTMDMMSVVGMVVVIHMGAMSLTLLSVYLAFFKYKMVIRFASIIAAVSFLGLSTSSSKSWITIWGLLSVFATSSVQIALRPIYNRTSTEFESTAISQASSILAGSIIFVIMIAHNHTYSLCFKITSLFHLIVPVFMYRY